MGFPPMRNTRNSGAGALTSPPGENLGISGEVKCTPWSSLSCPLPPGHSGSELGQGWWEDLDQLGALQQGGHEGASMEDVCHGVQRTTTEPLWC